VKPVSYGRLIVTDPFSAIAREIANMDKLLEQSTALNILLEALEDEQYDKQAHALVSKLNKISSQDLASAKNELDVSDAPNRSLLKY
jgi:hypothetical protein